MSMKYDTNDQGMYMYELTCMNCCVWMHYNDLLILMTLDASN